MNDVIGFVFGVVVLIGVLSMLTDSNASRIRNHRYWIVGWLFYILGLGFAGRLMLPLSTRLHVDDDQVVLYLFGAVCLTIVAVWLMTISHFRKQRRSLPTQEP